MLIGLINDSHFGCKGDVQYLLDYQEVFYKTIFFPHLLKNGVKEVFHLGDFFDRRKYINFGTLDRTKKILLDPLREYGINLTIIPGNHDVFAKNTNDINSLSLLMSEYTNIDQIHKPTVKEYSGTKFMFLPWLNNENYKSSMDFVQNNKAEILCAHLELAGFSMYAGVKNEQGLDASQFNKFESVLSGHFHHKSSNKNVHYLGTQYELTWHDHGDQKGFHTYDTETKVLEFQQNPNKLFEKLYYSDETPEDQKKFTIMNVSQFAGKVIKLFVTKKTKPALFESFIDRLYKQNLIDLTIMEDYSEFHESNVEFDIKDNSTKDLMDKYIDTASTDMDKNRLKTILNNIYIEALHTEVR